MKHRNHLQLKRDSERESRRLLWQKGTQRCVLSSGRAARLLRLTSDKRHEKLFLYYLLQTCGPSPTWLLPFGLHERNHSRQRKGSGFQGMAEMPRDSACLWNTGFSSSWPAEAAVWPAPWHSVQYNRAWVRACSFPPGWDDRSRACLLWCYWHVWCRLCGDIAFSILHGAFSFCS